MTEYAWASTETRKIVKGEERIVHFLDDQQTVRQTTWGHLYADVCRDCSLQPICGGLFDRGNGYDPAELSPVYMNIDPIVQRIIQDPADPSYPLRSLAAWRQDFDVRREVARREAEGKARNSAPSPEDRRRDGDESQAVGMVTDDSVKAFERKRRIEGRQAERKGVRLESDRVTRRGTPGQEP